MKFLLDTNIFIPLEPTEKSGLETQSALAAELVRIVAETGHHAYVHEASRDDIERDKDPTRRDMRRILFSKYPQISISAIAHAQVELILGDTDRRSNDWVDNHLLAALCCDAVDYLVTHDDKIQKKSRRLDLTERVFSLQEAVNYLRPFLFDKSFVPPPAVVRMESHQLDFNSSFFDGFREDYFGFDKWARECRRAQRPVWVINGSDDRVPLGLCIVKHEEPTELTPPISNCTRLLKICTFKIANHCVGLGYGELLLKTVFEYAYANKFSHCYISIMPKYLMLINLLQDFGFRYHAENPKLGDDFFYKSFVWTTEEENDLDPLSFNIKFGPRNWSQKTDGVYIVPIKPEFHRSLFPDCERQIEVWKGESPAGNSIRKAYLSKSTIKRLPEGSLILFYNSRILQCVTVIGIVERSIRSNDPERIARAVTKKTVYTLPDIREQCSTGELIAILFRQVVRLSSPIPLFELKKKGFLKAAPQTIQSIPIEVLGCIQQ